MSKLKEWIPGDSTDIMEFAYFPPKEWIDNYYKTNKRTIEDRLMYIMITKEMTIEYAKYLKEKENGKKI